MECPPQHSFHEIWLTESTESCSHCSEYVSLQKYFSHPSLDLPIAPIKPKLGLQIGGRHLVANHLDEVIMQGSNTHSDHNNDTPLLGLLLGYA